MHKIRLKIISVTAASLQPLLFGLLDAPSVKRKKVQQHFFVATLDDDSLFKFLIYTMILCFFDIMCQY